MSSPSNDSPVHTLIVKLHHRPGALDRLVGLLRRQGCVVTTLSFAPSHEPNLADVTVMFRGGHAKRVAQQAQRLVDVVEVGERVG
jgi:acetolactate synthase-1/3 small subunit